MTSRLTSSTCASRRGPRCGAPSTASGPLCRSHIEVRVDSPVAALEQFSGDVDLLVCGSRGYGPLGSVLLGGVSRRLVHRAACPVVVVPRGTERRARGAGRRTPSEVSHV